MEDRTDTTTPTRAYPVPRTGADPRFTLGLFGDVAEVLREHGYPPMTGADLTELGAALFGFLYGAPDA